MSGLGRVSVTDVVRAFGPDVPAATPASMKLWLEKEYLARTGGGFSYDPAIRALAWALKGISIKQALDYISKTGTPFGRPYNAAVFNALVPYVEAHEGQIYPLRYVAARIGSHADIDLHIGFKVPFVRVDKTGAKLVVPAFRNSFIPTWEQAALECSIALAFLAQNDFYGVDQFEYLCVRSDKSALERSCQVFTRDDLKVISPDVVNELLTKYFQAAAMLLDEGKGFGSTRMSGYHIIDPYHPEP